jgi:hypothetical protein
MARTGLTRQVPKLANPTSNLGLTIWGLDACTSLQIQSDRDIEHLQMSLRTEAAKNLFNLQLSGNSLAADSISLGKGQS